MNFDVFVGSDNLFIHNEYDKEYWPAQPGIRVASVIAFSVLCMCVLLGFVTFFLILLQYNIRLLDPNCNVCAFKFVPGVNLRRDDTSTQTVMKVIMIFY